MNYCMNLQFYMVVENGVEGMVIPAMGCPRRAVCPSCSSETGRNRLHSINLVPFSTQMNLPLHCDILFMI